MRLLEGRGGPRECRTSAHWLLSLCFLLKLSGFTLIDLISLGTSTLSPINLLQGQETSRGSVPSPQGCGVNEVLAGDMPAHHSGQPCTP